MKYCIIFAIMFAIAIETLEFVYREIRKIGNELKRLKKSKIISFDIFLKSYNRHPHKWDITFSNLVVQYDEDMRYRSLYDRKYSFNGLYFRFNFKDWKRYLKWRKNITNEQKDQAYAEAYRDISDYELLGIEHENYPKEML